MSWRLPLAPCSSTTGGASGGPSSTRCSRPPATSTKRPCGGWARSIRRTANSVSTARPPRTAAATRRTANVMRMKPGTEDIRSPTPVGRTDRIDGRRWRRSDAAAFDLLGQALDHLVDLGEMRIDLQRAAEHVERVLLVAELLENHAEARHRAEVARLKDQHLADILHRPSILLAHVVQRGAAVPGLDVVGLDLHQGIEQLDGEVEVFGVDRRFGPRHEQIGGVTAGGEPERPDAVLDLLAAFSIGRGLQGAEQEIEIARAVAALRTRQILRRLHRLDGLALRWAWRRHRLRGRDRGQQRKGCGR